MAKRRAKAAERINEKAEKDIEAKRKEYQDAKEKRVGERKAEEADKQASQHTTSKNNDNKQTTEKLPDLEDEVNIVFNVKTITDALDKFKKENENIGTPYNMERLKLISDGLSEVLNIVTAMVGITRDDLWYVVSSQNIKDNNVRDFKEKKQKLDEIISNLKSNSNDLNGSVDVKPDDIKARLIDIDTTIKEIEIECKKGMRECREKRKLEKYKKDVENIDTVYKLLNGILKDINVVCANLQSQFKTIRKSLKSSSDNTGKLSINPEVYKEIFVHYSFGSYVNAFIYKGQDLKNVIFNAVNNNPYLKLLSVGNKLFVENSKMSDGDIASLEEIRSKSISGLKNNAAKMTKKSLLQIYPKLDEMVNDIFELLVEFGNVRIERMVGKTLEELNQIDSVKKLIEFCKTNNATNLKAKAKELVDISDNDSKEAETSKNGAPVIPYSTFLKRLVDTCHSSKVMKDNAECVNSLTMFLNNHYSEFDFVLERFKGVIGTDKEKSSVIKSMGFGVIDNEWVLYVINPDGGGVEKISTKMSPIDMARGLNKKRSEAQVQVEQFYQNILDKVINKPLTGHNADAYNEYLKDCKEKLQEIESKYRKDIETLKNPNELNVEAENFLTRIIKCIESTCFKRGVSGMDKAIHNALQSCGTDKISVKEYTSIPNPVNNVTVGKYFVTVEAKTTNDPTQHKKIASMSEFPLEIRCHFEHGVVKHLNRYLRAAEIVVYSNKLSNDSATSENTDMSDEERISREFLALVNEKRNIIVDAVAGINAKDDVYKKIANRFERDIDRINEKVNNKAYSSYPEKIANDLGTTLDRLWCTGVGGKIANALENADIPGQLGFKKINCRTPSEVLIYSSDPIIMRPKTIEQAGTVTDIKNNAYKKTFGNDEVEDIILPIVSPTIYQSKEFLEKS